MDAIFKALGDGNRRRLLDALERENGRTLGELEATLPHLSRFGVMKHLKLLEKASLVTTRRAGRYKYHYLNPVPIQQVADRWISRFAAPLARGMVDLKSDLEGGDPMQSRPKHVFTTIIQTTREQLWEALTEPRLTQKYFFGLKVTTDWIPDSGITYVDPDGASTLR